MIDNIHSLNNNNKSNRDIELIDAEIPYNIEIIDGSFTFWHNIRRPRGIIFFFHGCRHIGEHWFMLPEEIKIINHAISLNLLPVAFSASDRVSEAKCWGEKVPYEFPDSSVNQDLIKIGNAIPKLIESENWDNLPLYLFGVSSGAMFASMIPRQLPNYTFKGVMLEIAPGTYEIFDRLPIDYDNTISSFYPKVGFIELARDETTSILISQSRATLAVKKVPTELWVSDRVPITRYYFSNSIPDISEELSIRFCNILFDNDFIDNKGYLNRNPRGTKWWDLFKNSILDTDIINIEDYYEHILELMNVCYGFHEITSQNSREIMLWAMK